MTTKTKAKKHKAHAEPKALPVSVGEVRRRLEQDRRAGREVIKTRLGNARCQCGQVAHIAVYNSPRWSAALRTCFGCGVEWAEIARQVSETYWEIQQDHADHVQSMYHGTEGAAR
jgi:hypothetical protein